MLAAQRLPLVGYRELFFGTAIGLGGGLRRGHVSISTGGISRDDSVLESVPLSGGLTLNPKSSTLNNKFPRALQDRDNQIIYVSSDFRMLGLV